MVAKVDVFIISWFLLGLETRLFCPVWGFFVCFFCFPENQQAGVLFLKPKRNCERIAIGEGVSGVPWSGEALPGTSLQSAMLSLSSLAPLSLEFSLPHSPIFYINLDSVSDAAFTLKPSHPA